MKTLTAVVENVAALTVLALLVVVGVGTFAPKAAHAARRLPPPKPTVLVPDTDGRSKVAHLEVGEVLWVTLTNGAVVPVPVPAVRDGRPRVIPVRLPPE